MASVSSVATGSERNSGSARTSPNARSGTRAPASEPSGVFGSLLGNAAIKPLGSAGNIAMSFAGANGSHVLSGGHNVPGASVALSGVPVVGFMAYDIVNASAQQGVLANYGGVFPLRSTSPCEGSASDCN